jgi:hypothetical protein
MSTLDLLRRSRWITLGLALSMGSAALSGCAPEELAAAEDGEVEAAPQADNTADEIANVLQTRGASSEHRQLLDLRHARLDRVDEQGRTGTDANYSESYVTFWDWFAKITTGSGVSSDHHQRHDPPRRSRRAARGSSR